MIELEIRKATQKDVDEISRLFDDYRVFYGKESDLEGAQQFLCERLNNGESVIFMAIYNDSVCGFMQLYPLFSSTRMKKLWLLNDLFVASPHRNKGIAKLLLEKAKSYAKETNSVGFILETARNNVEANHLYRSMGLEIDNLHNYYSYEINTY